ncbi:hypothetical protein MTO96_002154 [Rhipicephalus appendiculatus]
MAQNAAGQQDASDSETELEFVTADFTELSLNYTRLLEESITRSVAPCDNFYRFVCTGWIRDHGRGGPQRSVADSVQREALLDAMNAFEERRQESLATTLDRQNRDRRRRREAPRRRRSSSAKPVDANDVRAEAEVDAQGLGLGRPQSGVPVRVVQGGCDQEKSEAKKVAEFMKKYTKFPAVEPQNAADLVAATIELSLTWRIDTLFVVNVFADLDDDGRPAVEIGENVELFHWFRWRNVLKDSGKLEEFFLSHLQAVPEFRSSLHEYLLTEIADADSQVIPSLRTDEVLQQDLTYRNLSTLIPGVSESTWVAEINRQTEPYFKVEADDKLRVENVHYLQLVGRMLNYTGKPLIVPMFVGWTLLRQLAPRASYKAATFVFKDRASYVDACFAFVVDAMPLAAAYPYLSKLPTTRSEAVARTLVKDVRRELATVFANVPWMDNATRTAASDKLAAMSEVLVKPALPDRRKRPRRALRRLLDSGRLPDSVTADCQVLGQARHGDDLHAPGRRRRPRATRVPAAHGERPV